MMISRLLAIIALALFAVASAKAGPAEEVAEMNKKELQRYVGKRLWIVIRGHPNNVVETCSTMPTKQQAVTAEFYKNNCLHLKQGTFVGEKALINNGDSAYLQVNYEGQTKYISWFSTSHFSFVDPLEVKKECERRGQPKIGMTIDEATATCWGKPRRVVKTTTVAGVQQDFIYDRGHTLRFENEKLSAILETTGQ